MKQLTIILFIIFPIVSYAQRYKVTWNKVGTWTAMGVSGAMWGAREAYHADSRVFEKKFKVGEYSFWGSQQWQRNYVNNRYYAIDGRINPHKPEIFGNFGRDYWHTSSWLNMGITKVADFSIGNSKQPFKHKFLDLAIGTTISIITANLTYKLLRK